MYSQYAFCSNGQIQSYMAVSRYTDASIIASKLLLFIIHFTYSRWTSVHVHGLNAFAVFSVMAVSFLEVNLFVSEKALMRSYSSVFFQYFVSTGYTFYFMPIVIYCHTGLSCRLPGICNGS